FRARGNSSAPTANMGTRSCGRSRPSSGGTVSRAGSRLNASAATRDTSPGSRKRCSSSLHPLERTQAGLPAGKSETEPAAAGRRARAGAGGGPPAPLHPFVPQVQFLRRPGEQEERVVGQGGQVEFEGRRRTAARRLQADPPEPVARRRGLVWEEPEEVERPER